VRSLPLSHEHEEGHAGHSHGLSAAADARKLGVALGLILGFMAFELIVGLGSGGPRTRAAAIGL
jgi:cobalt-zinc-cadmium efflux system protein